MNSPTIKSKAPFSNVEGGTYYGEVVVSISSITPNSLIYYTFDNTDPTTSSPNFPSNTPITISNVGTNVLKAMSKAYNTLASDVVTFTYTIMENTNFNIEAVTDNYLDRMPFNFEPTNSSGLQMYTDLTQYLPDKLKGESEFMELIYTFQDYMNNGFREIPNYYKTLTYSQAGGICDSSINKTYIEYLEPYDHNIEMTLDYENNSQGYNPTTGEMGDFSKLKHIDEYDRNRDIETFAIEEADLLEYKKQNSSVLGVGSIFYDNYAYYKTLDSLIVKVSDDDIYDDFLIFVSTTESYRYDNSDLECQFSTKSELISKLFEYSGKFTVNLYFCNISELLAQLNYAGDFTLCKTFFPTFDGRHDIYNESDDIISVVGVFNKSTISSVLSNRDGRFRISIDIDNSIQVINDLTFNNTPMSVVLNGRSALSLSGDFPVLAPRFKKIIKWQDPKTFYEYFKAQNEYRISDKKSSILDKIHKIAYLKDIDVIDYEYVQFIASQMGYNLDIDQEDIENNPYYVTKAEKESALRAIIRNLPSFYRIKCTKNGLESLLLSFGIVGEIIYLHTIGDITHEGYSDFINSELIEGREGDGIFNDELAQELKIARMNNASLANTVIDDWFPSPHFRIELDLLKQNLRLDKNKLGISLINKAIRKTKPINTVFQGFYGKMFANFAYIFIHKPKLLTSIYCYTSIHESCDELDVWDARCKMGITKASMAP